jgi:Ca2+-binding EF-hand superfamily protein
MNKIPLVLALGCLGFAATTFAADGTERGERGLAALDTDGDGSVSFEEFAARQADLLARIDSDGDGVLTIDEFLNARPGPGRGGMRGRGGDNPPSEFDAERRAEMQAMMTQRATERFQEMDLNDDKIVTLDEFQEANFLNLDSDNNGVLTGSELRRQQRGRPGGGRMGRRRPDADLGDQQGG